MFRVDFGQSARAVTASMTGSQERLYWRTAVPAALLALLLAGVDTAAGAIIPVTTTEQKISDVSDTTKPGCSLQEAIFSANRDENTAISKYNTNGTPVTVTTSCVRGSGDDTIVLPVGALFLLNKIVDDADNIVGPTATPVITSNITILANGATLQRSGGFNFRLFAVGSGGLLTIQTAYIKNFLARGGDGGDGGGGGGMGAGGAIYVKDGSLVIQNSTFQNNAALGGSGGKANSTQGSGGGGMGGSGGTGGGFCSGGSGASRNGGGGGGSRGGGADGVSCAHAGGGGGTVLSASGREGGFACGGNGGASDVTVPVLGSSGDSAQCDGGGGGGGQEGVVSSGDGGSGKFGGGGGGGGESGGDGGSGGFGGGGGAGWSGILGGAPGGNGGFAGGGGAGSNGSITDGDLGTPGKFGGFGNSSDGYGGSGGGLGGAIFNDNGHVQITNSTFTGNVALGGAGTHSLQGGGSAGGAIFSRNGHLTMQNVTVGKNQSSPGIGGGVFVLQDPASAETLFILQNTIIANNGDGECWISGTSISGNFTGNLITQNFNCPGVVSTGDPQLLTLGNNQGPTPTMAITTNSPARNSADVNSSPASDQRGQTRPAGGGFDIGAFELCLTGPPIDPIPCRILSVVEVEHVTLTMQVSPTGGGTTSPAVGAIDEPQYSLVPLKATPNAGFRFTNWSANVTGPTNPTTTVVMDQAKTVTANFATCACATDVSSSIGITPGGFVVNPITKRWVQTVTLKNNSAATLTGPISLVLDNLSSNAALFNATGSTALMLPAGSPYIDANINLAAGQSTPVSLQFTNPSNTAITYATRVLAGPGAR